MIQVWAGSIPSGVIHQLPENRFSFTYRADAGRDVAVSLTMPVRPESWLFPGLHPVFDMNLPEGNLRQWFNEHVAKTIPNFNDLELLRITGKSQIGRLRFTSFGEALTDDDLPGCNLQEILLYKGSQGLFDDLMNRYARYSGISGAQPKVLLRSDGTGKHKISQGPQKSSRKTSEFRFTTKIATHIVKAWTKDFPELALNEFLCLQAARNAGLHVARAVLSEDRRILVVDRFDLQEDGSFLGFEETCSLVGKVAREKYNGSYEQVAKALTAYSLPSRLMETLHRYFLSVVLTVLVRNGDAHLKNFGILYQDPCSRRGWGSPVFDVVTTTAYLPRDTLALTLGGTKRWPTRKALEKFGQMGCGLPLPEVREAIEAAESGVTAVIPELKRWIKSEPAFLETGKTMLSAWNCGLESLGRTVI